ncbi:MAG: hypothetical protein A2X49_11710 [Lentisphaerae bacterium GWF2_52_8]|nr:MAG: hypothetical protein A2X49_11710 [Lentisphaerae bacterium GWF2_52_8]
MAAAYTKYSVIIPTLNESDNIIEMISRVDKLFPGEVEIIVSDGNSSDDTGLLVRSFAESHPNVRFLSNSGDPDLSPSVVHGFDEASGEFLACIDGDLQHDENCLPQMMALLAEADMVVGSRYLGEGGIDRDWPFFRRLASRAGFLVVQILTRTRLSDPMSGFFAIRKSSFLAVREHLKPKGFKIMLELLLRLRKLEPGFRIEELGIKFHCRVKGKSKFNIQAALKLILMLAECRFDARRSANSPR